MQKNEDNAALLRSLAELTASPDDALLVRYEMQRPRRPPGIYWQLRWLAGLLIRWVKSTGLWKTDTWPVCLKHASVSRDARPLLIWAVGADYRTLRDSCNRLYDLLKAQPVFVPVLVTDVADFAYFSRLGWLVEYVPTIAGNGESFERRKAGFIADLYRDAPILAANAALASASGLDEIERLAMRH